MQKIDFVFVLNTVILPTSNVIVWLHISTLWRGGGYQMCWMSYIIYLKPWIAEVWNTKKMIFEQQRSAKICMIL